MQNTSTNKNSLEFTYRSLPFHKLEILCNQKNKTHKQAILTSNIKDNIYVLYNLKRKWNMNRRETVAQQR